MEETSRRSQGNAAAVRNTMKKDRASGGNRQLKDLTESPKAKDVKGRATNTTRFDPYKSFKF